MFKAKKSGMRISKVLLCLLAFVTVLGCVGSLFITGFDTRVEAEELTATEKQYNVNELFSYMDGNVPKNMTDFSQMPSDKNKVYVAIYNDVRGFLKAPLPNGTDATNHSKIDAAQAKVGKLTFT